MKRVILILVAFATGSVAMAQNIGINTTGAAPDASAMLDIVSTSKGLLIPRVPIGNVAAAAPVTAPVTSLLVYNTNAAITGGSGVGFYYWDGGQWVRFDTDGSGDDWEITGNSGTTAGTNFLGTTDGQQLDFRTNNTIRFSVANGNQVFAGANGTAALPFYSRSTDPNTGMYFIGADELGFAASGVERLSLSPTLSVFNEGSADTDFRIESNGNINMFYMDAGLNRVSVGSNATAGTFNVTGNSYHSDDIYLRDGAVASGDVLVRIFDSADDGIIDIYENNARNIRLHGNGVSVFNEQGIATNDLRVEGSGKANLFFVDAGNAVVGIDGVPAAPYFLGLPIHTVGYPIEMGSDGGTGDQVCLAYYSGADPYVIPEQPMGAWGWGYSGTVGNPWYWSYTDNLTIVSQQKTKREITSVSNNEALEAYVMNDILNLDADFYKKKGDLDELIPGLENRYRPHMQLGYMVDEVPAYACGGAFAGVNPYALTTMGLIGVKYNNKEIEKLKSAVGAGAKINDFGSGELNGNEMWIRFDSEFSNKLSSTPVVTVTSNNADVSLSIVEKSDSGFKVKASGNASGVSFDWIAMGKSNAMGPTQEIAGSIDPALLEKLEVSPEKRAEILEMHLNIKATPELNQEAFQYLHNLNEEYMSGKR